jgi:DNA polymerase-3 subunit epsilon
MRRPIIFDTETTGTRPDRDFIVEIAAYDPVRDRSFERLINPGIPIPQEAIHVHKITDAMVKDAPRFGEVAQEFIAFCDGDIALVAHNLVAFDMPFLQAEFRRAKLKVPDSWACIDTLIWARRYRKDIPRHSLQFLRQLYGIQANEAHRALNDVKVLYEVYKALVDDLSCDHVIELLNKNKVKNSPVEAPKPQELALSLF